MRIAYWITQASNTQSGYVILIAFQLQQWLRERVSWYAIRALPVFLLWYRPTNLDRTALTSVTAHANRFADWANTDNTCAGLVLTVEMLGVKVRTKWIP